MRTRIEPTTDQMDAMLEKAFAPDLLVWTLHDPTDPNVGPGSYVVKYQAVTPIAKYCVSVVPILCRDIDQWIDECPRTLCVEFNDYTNWPERGC